MKGPQARLLRLNSLDLFNITIPASSSIAGRDLLSSINHFPSLTDALGIEIDAFQECLKVSPFEFCPRFVQEHDDVIMSATFPVSYTHLTLPTKLEV